MCEFLEPFYEMTNLISSFTNPTTNLYLFQVQNIECLLLKILNCEDDLIRDMTVNMKRKFDKYQSDYNVLVVMTVVLDPQIKLLLLEFCCNSIKPTPCEGKINIMKKKLFQLYE